ncbi:hypothetical protein KI387_011762, partial [Taxus chinensis]
SYNERIRPLLDAIDTLRNMGVMKAYNCLVLLLWETSRLEPGRSINDTPITLNVGKSNAPDLTMVDFPSITRVPVHGQPQDIYDQISQVIKQYITPKESIIMNVLSASVDFPTCESIRMSQLVDEKGERTLAVFTKVNKAAEVLFEKVTVDAVNIGLGYVCVRNRIGNESNA